MMSFQWPVRIRADWWEPVYPEWNSSLPWWEPLAANATFLRKVRYRLLGAEGAFRSRVRIYWEIVGGLCGVWAGVFVESVELIRSMRGRADVYLVRKRFEAEGYVRAPHIDGDPGFEVWANAEKLDEQPRAIASPDSPVATPPETRHGNTDPLLDYPYLLAYLAAPAERPPAPTELALLNAAGLDGRIH